MLIKNQIKCTLWDEHVDQLTPYFQIVASDPVILLIQLCRAKFMDSDYTPLRCIESGSRLDVGFPTNGLHPNDILVTPIEDIYLKKQHKRDDLDIFFFVHQLGEYWVAGRIVGVESISDWYFISCKTNSCKKKLAEQGGMMYCGGCKNSWHEGIVRYRLIVRVADHTGDAPMLILDRECADLVGMSAAELKAKYPEGNNCIPPELGRLRGMSMVFRIVMKKEQVESYYSAFTVLRICRDEPLVTQHCSGFLGAPSAEMVPGHVGGSLDVGCNSEQQFGSDEEEFFGVEDVSDGVEDDITVGLDDISEDLGDEHAADAVKGSMIKDLVTAGGSNKTKDKGVADLESEHVGVPLKRSLLKEFGMSGSIKKAKEVVVKQEK
ncbi:PREDICTED: uncharacterized protein LOC109183792 [Ipomoea nil]|uniref:uncharacterized protein LOC109183792 n=1 Tax=Ipomoea nil TaxID=35883 RepID=UPI000901DB94|nr:PREDICTED: uncharacterized protein LOC109183792 [Ipomoea nil]